MTSTAFEQLAVLIDQAKPVPLTGQIRIEAEGAFRLIDEARAEIPEAAPILERLRILIENGLPMPLTDYVRVERRGALALLEEARSAERTLAGFVSDPGGERLFDRKR